MIKGTDKALLLATIPVIILLQACSSNTLYSDSVVMPGKTWELSNVPEFSFPVADTTILTNIIFTLRTGSDYPFRNIYFFVTTLSPYGRILADTIEYDLADEQGNWYGKGIGDIHELNLPYRTNVYFTEKGLYRFKIRHGMRIGSLKGIYDLGLTIEKTEK
jgi:gliding motility-associated lipoprotein GldH